MKRIAAAVLTAAFCTSLFAQAPAVEKTRRAGNSAAGQSDVKKGTPGQPINEAYTESIIKNTTIRCQSKSDVEWAKRSAPGATVVRCRSNELGSVQSALNPLRLGGTGGFPASAPVEGQLAAFPFLKHLGIYGYWRDTLLRLVRFPVSPLENAEKLEQLRALDNGIEVSVVKVDYESIGVDVPADVQRVERILKQRQ